MSMSMHVVGYKPADHRWKKMKSVWDSCIAAEVVPPKVVVDYFLGKYPDDAPGMEVELEDTSAKKWSDEDREGFQIDITTLPDGVRFIRFYCSW